jgi:glyoxylase-like metal-dependent hydrolase (beta-lactamase superfamily II)
MMLARKPDEVSACSHRPALSRALWAVWLVVALLFGVVAGHGWAREFEPVSVRLEPVQVSPRVWYVMGDAGPVSAANEGFNSNAGFVVTDEGVVVFDALGSPALGAVLLQRIQQLTTQPVRRVIVSHYHADHFYGLQAFKAQGAEVWAHRRALEYLASDAPRLRLDERRQSLFPWVNEFTRIIPPDVVIDGDREFTLGGVRFQLFSAGPAHTPEDLMMLVPDEKVLFAGDLIFAGRVPFVGDADSRAWLGALDRLVERAPSIIVTGHGPHSRSGLNDVTLTRDYLRHLRAEMGRGVEQMLTFEEAYAAADWSRFRHLPAFSAANRGNAYNTFILMEREALSRP